MPIDLSDLTPDELRTLINDATQAFRAAEVAAQTETADRRGRLGQAITDLEALLGPVEGEPGTGNIRAVRRYDAQTMGQNAGIALDLAFAGLEQLTTTVLNIAHVIAAER